MIRNLFFLTSGFLLVTACFLGCAKSSDFAPQTSYTQGKSGSTARFTIYGNFLYTVDGTTLTSYDITDGAKPVLRDQQHVGFEIETIYPFNNMLFIGSTSVIHIFNLSNPAKPQKLSQAVSPTAFQRCDPVIAKDSVAYATLRMNITGCGSSRTSSILAVYDIKDPANPVEKATLGMISPIGLDYSDTILYVTDAPGFHILDISSPYSPVMLGKAGTGNYFEVITYGTELYAIREKATDVFSIEDLTRPTLLATIN